jgi:putative DNA primase/helicase
MSRESIEAALLQENERRCDPPLTPSEVSNIAASVARYKPAELANSTRFRLTDEGVVFEGDNDD